MADVLRAALVATQGALAAAAAAAATGAQQQQRQQQSAHPQQAQAAAAERPELVLALGHSLVARLPASFVAAHGGSGSAAAAAVAAAVQRGLQSLYVGRAMLSAPAAAVLTAGPSLHLWDQAPAGAAAASAPELPRQAALL